MIRLEVLGLLFSLAGGYLAGWIISRYTKQEIKQGKKYLQIFSGIIFIACLFAVSNYITHKTDDSLVIMLSCMFLLMIPVAGLKHA